MDYAVIAGAVLLTALLAALPLFSPPDWAEDLGDRKLWTKLALSTGLLGAGLAVGGGLALRDAPFFLFLAGSVALGLFTVVTFQSAVTDYRLRLVDRRMLNLATAVTAVLGLAALVSMQAVVTAAVSVSLLLFAAVVYLFVFSVGASDARAVALVATAAVPVMGWNGFVWASLLAGVSFMAIGLGVAFIKRTMKSSFPAVPMLLFPYWIVLALTPFMLLPFAFPSLAV